MKRLISHINLISLNAVVHSMKIGRSENNNALPFLTSLAAIIYILSSTLGSGSYKELLSFTSFIYQISMFIVLFFALVFFSLTLVSYLDNNLNIAKYESSSSYKFRLFESKYLPRLSIVSITPAIIVFLYYIYRGGLKDTPNQQEIEIFFFSVFFFLSIWLIAVVERIAASNEQILFFAFLFFIGSCSLAVSYNIYRDSYKLSFNVNTQYCYWVLNGLNHESISSRSFSKNDRDMCEALQNKNIEMRFIRSKPFED